MYIVPPTALNVDPRKAERSQKYEMRGREGNTKSGIINKSQLRMIQMVTTRGEKVIKY